MKPFLKFLLFISFFSFLMGVWWNLQSSEKHIAATNKSGVRLKLLYRKGYFSPQLLSNFEEKTGLHLEGYPMETDQSLWEELSKHPDNYDLIQLFSYMAKAFVESQVFAQLNPQWISQRDKVSADFNHLPFDPANKYFLPLNWGLNGFLWNPKNGKPPSSLKVLMTNKKLKGKIFLLPQQMEIFSYMQKTGAIFWLDQENWTQISKATKKLLEQVQVENTLSENIWKSGRAEVVQIANGPAAEIIQQAEKGSAQFWLPEEKVNLWISLIGISKNTSHLESAHQLINFLLEDSSIQLLVKLNRHATSLQPDKVAQIKPMQLPSYLRQVTLNKIHLPIETVFFRPIWFQTLSEALPQVFPKPPKSLQKTSTPLTPGSVESL